MGIRKYLLAHERMSSGSLGPHKKLLSQLKSIAADGETPDFARKIAAVELELKTLEAFTLRSVVARRAAAISVVKRSAPKPTSSRS